MIQYSVIIPVFNGERTVEPLFYRIKSFFEAVSYSYEVVFVYDCGKDKSLEVLEKLAKSNPDVISLIKLSRNFGQHNALICGFEYASGAYFITMDEDLQHSPEDIEILINKQKEGDFDVVYGKYKELNHSVFRNVSSRLLKKIISIGIPELHHDYSAYRFIKANVAKSTIEMHNSYTFLDGYLSWITSNVGSCLVSHSERQGGVSSYNIKKLLNHTINIFVTFSDLPIRVVTWLSLLFFISTSLYSFWMLFKKIIYNDLIPGFTSIIVLLGFGIGSILLALGILGQYLHRINLKTTKRPNYIVIKKQE